MTTNLKESQAFLMIPTGAAYDEDLLKAPKAILVLGEIVSMLNITGSFYMSNATLAKKLHCSTSTIGRYLILLEEKKMIKRQVITDEKKNVQYRKIYAGKNLAGAFTQNWQNDSSTPIPTDEDRVPTHEEGLSPHVRRGVPTCEEGVSPHVGSKENNKREHIKENNIRSNDQSLEERFEKLWVKYPRKQGKKDAFRHYKAWIKASPKHTDEYLMDRLEKYKAYLQANKTELRYVQKGSTWFNGSFDDDWSITPANNYSQPAQSAKIPQEAFDTSALNVNEDDLPF